MPKIKILKEYTAKDGSTCLDYESMQERNLRIDNFSEIERALGVEDTRDDLQGSAYKDHRVFATIMSRMGIRIILTQEGFTKDPDQITDADMDNLESAEKLLSGSFKGSSFGSVSVDSIVATLRKLVG